MGRIHESFLKLLKLVEHFLKLVDFTFRKSPIMNKLLEERQRLAVEEPVEKLVDDVSNNLRRADARAVDVMF